MNFGERLRKKAIAMRKLAELSPEGREMRQTYARDVGVPILRRVEEQSSIQEIFVADPIPLGGQALYQVALNATPSTNAYTGSQSQLTCYEHPGLGPVPQQFRESTELIVPPKYYEMEAGFNRNHALHARFSFMDQQIADIKDGMLGQIESSGWSVVQTVAGNASFPAAQKVSISAGSAGTAMFSRQLFSEMLKAAMDIGLVENPEYSLSMYISTTSFKEFIDWDISTEFDISTPAALSEKEKNEIAMVDNRKGQGFYRGVKIRGLRRLATSDVVADHDYCYMFVVSPRPEFLARPVFPAPNGQEIEMIDDPYSPYSTNEIKTKARFAENHAVLDARAILVGDIDRS